MHIVYVTGRFADKDGDVLTGMPNYIYKIAKYMQDIQNQVSILTIGNADGEWMYDGIPVYSRKLFDNGVWGKEFGMYLVYPVIREYLFNKTLQQIHRKRPITLVQYAGWYGVGMLYARSFPSVLRISTYTKVQLYAKHTPKELRYITLTERMAAKNFDGIIAPSHALGDRYAKDVRRKVTVLPTPFCYPRPEEEDTSILDEKLSHKKYFLFFGRISPDKGIDTIARCIREILAGYPEHCFCFAGEIALVNGRNMMQHLKKSAGEKRDRVIYLGNITHRQLYPVIRNAECVVLPSLMDNLPNAGLEAMWLNGIVIGTRGASFDEMYEDKISGLLMDIDDSEELLEKISYVMHMTADEKERMKTEAKKKIEIYESQAAGEKLERYYKYILEQRRSNGKRKL